MMERVVVMADIEMGDLIHLYHSPFHALPFLEKSGLDFGVGSRCRLMGIATRDYAKGELLDVEEVHFRRFAGWSEVGVGECDWEPT